MFRFMNNEQLVPPYSRPYMLEQNLTTNMCMYIEGAVGDVLYFHLKSLGRGWIFLNRSKMQALVDSLPRRGAGIITLH